MKNVLIVTQYFYPENFRINEVVKLMRDQGWEVSIFTSYPSYPNKNIYKDWNINMDIDMNINIYRFFSWRRSTGSFFDIVMHYLGFLSAIFLVPFIFYKKKYDLIFCYQPSPVTTGLVSLFIGKYLSCKKAIWIQDLWPNTLEDKLANKKNIIYKLIGLISKFIYSSHDFILCQSVGITDKVKKDLAVENVFYLPNFSEHQYSSVKMGKKNKSQFNLVFTGNIGESQDFTTIIKALDICIKKNENIHLTIVGDGRYKKNLEIGIKNYGLQKNITLKDSCCISDVISYYEFADAMLISLASKAAFEITVPGKFQSYLMAGKPIIGCISGDVHRMINDNLLGVAVNAGDFQGLAKAIIDMSQKTPLELIDISRNCRLYYYENFDVKIFMERLCKIIGT